MFIFLLALGEDYNILVMSRIREEAHHYPLREAVSRAIAVTGTTVTSAGMVLAGTFAVFAVVGGRGSGGAQIRDVGAGPRTRRADGHVRGPHRARSVHGGAPRPVELVAVPAQPPAGRPARGRRSRRGRRPGWRRSRRRAVRTGRRGAGTPSGRAGEPCLAGGEPRAPAALGGHPGAEGRSGRVGRPGGQPRTSRTRPWCSLKSPRRAGGGPRQTGGHTPALARPASARAARMQRRTRDMPPVVLAR